MNTIRLLVTTLLVMTSTLVAAEEAKGSLTLTPQRVTDAAQGSDIPLTRPEWYELFRASGHRVP